MGKKITFPDRAKEKALSRLRDEMKRVRTPFPENDLNILAEAARGVTGQSAICRYLLFLLIGRPEPSGFLGDGLVELRALDRKLSDAFLTLLSWWRDGETNEPIYKVIDELESRFRKTL